MSGSPVHQILCTRNGDLQYVARGQGPALLAFHGAIGNAESMDWFVRTFSSHFRVLVPSLGQSDDVLNFCDRVERLLQHEGVESATVFGISFGGLLAQSFVRRHPMRVARLILMSCGIARRSSATLYIFARILARSLPLRALRRIVSLFLSRRLVHTPPTEAAVRRALGAHRQRLAGIAERIDRDLVVARFRVAADVHRAGPDIRRAIEGSEGRTLLLLASDDPLFSARERRRLRLMLPNANIHMFAQGGHLIPLFNADEMRRIVIQFAGPR